MLRIFPPIEKEAMDGAPDVSLYGLGGPHADSDQLVPKFVRMPMKGEPDL